MVTKASVPWLIKDNEAGEIRRFRCNTSDPDAALRAYIRWLGPHLSLKEAIQQAENFNGEIWPEHGVQDIGTIC